MISYYVYILKCSDDSFYTGISNSLERRVYEHQNGIDQKCYTYKRRPIELVWFEEFTNPNEAILKEKQLKGWSRKKKIALIEQNYDKLIEFSKNYTQYRNKQ